MWRQILALCLLLGWLWSKSNQIRIDSTMFRIAFESRDVETIYTALLSTLNLFMGCNQIAIAKFLIIFSIWGTSKSIIKRTVLCTENQLILHVSSLRLWAPVAQADVVIRADGVVTQPQSSWLQHITVRWLKRHDSRNVNKCDAISWMMLVFSKSYSTSFNTQYPVYRVDTNVHQFSVFVHVCSSSREVTPRKTKPPVLLQEL